MKNIETFRNQQNHQVLVSSFPFYMFLFSFYHCRTHKMQRSTLHSACFFFVWPHGRSLGQPFSPRKSAVTRTHRAPSCTMGGSIACGFRVSMWFQQILKGWELTLRAKWCTFEAPNFLRLTAWHGPLKIDGLEDELTRFLLKDAIFAGAMFVSFREGRSTMVYYEKWYICIRIYSKSAYTCTDMGE